MRWLLSGAVVAAGLAFYLRATLTTVAGTVEGALAHFPVVVFTDTKLAHCREVRRVLAGVAVPGYHGPLVYDLARRRDRRRMLDYLSERTGRSQLPYVFVGGQDAGDAPAIMRHVRSGELHRAVGLALRTGIASAGNVSTEVEAVIRQHAVVVFSKSYCPYCRAAKRALAQAAIGIGRYEGAFALELDLRLDGAAIQDFLATKTGVHSVPQIFVGGSFVGDSDKTVALEKSGELTHVIAAAVGVPPPATAAVVEHAISDCAVVVFSKSYCPYCRNAKAALTNAGAPIPEYEDALVFEVDLRPDAADMQQYLSDKTGVHTVPQVFIGGSFLGGDDKVEALAQTGELTRLIARAMDVAPPQPDAVVEWAISHFPVVIFSKSFCPYCRKAKMALSHAGEQVASYVGAFVLELDLRVDGAEMQRHLASRTGMQTVPQVFIGGTFIGGGDATVALDDAGELTKLIAQAVER